VLARAIFTPHIGQSRAALVSDIFSPAIGVSLFFAILDRPSCDTDVDYVRAICEQILAGTLTHLTIEGVSNMIKDDQAAPLKYFMTKDQHVAGASVAASYRVLTEDEEQKKMLDMASSGIFPPNLQRMIDEADVSALNKEEQEEDEADEQQQPDEGPVAIRKRYRGFLASIRCQPLLMATRGSTPSFIASMERSSCIGRICAPMPRIGSWRARWSAFKRLICAWCNIWTACQIPVMRWWT
jgi:hypothetical protein